MVAASNGPFKKECVLHTVQRWNDNANTRGAPYSSNSRTLCHDMEVILIAIIIMVREPPQSPGFVHTPQPRGAAVPRRLKLRGKDVSYRQQAVWWWSHTSEDALLSAQPLKVISEKQKSYIKLLYTAEISYRHYRADLPFSFTQYIISGPLDCCQLGTCAQGFWLHVIIFIVSTILRISIISDFSAIFLAFLFFPCNPSRRQGGRELLDDGHEMNNFFFARIQGISAQKGNSLHLDRMYSYHFDGLVFK